MDERSAGTLAGSDALAGPTTATRVGEDRAARILERAAALDAKRSSEIEIDQLREAAAAAGISPEAFDQAMEEQEDGIESAPRAVSSKLNWQAQEAPIVAAGVFAHYSAVLRDLLGEDGRVSVVEDRIEWQDDEGLVVSINASSRATTAAVSAGGRLRGRLWAITLSILPILLVSFMFAVEAEEALLVLMGAFFALIAAWGGTIFQYRRERKALRKKVAQIRRQLQRLLEPGPERR